MKNLCSGCGLYFFTLQAFDEHRIGSYTRKARRCLPVDQMLRRGFTQRPDKAWDLSIRPKVTKKQINPPVVYADVA